MIVAEISANHLGDIDRALALVESAAWAGADAVKIQTYRPDSITIDYDGDEFIIDAGPWKGMKLYDLYQQAATPLSWHARIFERAKDLGILCFSSPFSIEDVDFLQQFDPPYYKIASFEITDVNLIAAAAATGKPIIISTGMADFDDINDAVTAAHFAEDITLLHCVSMYPTPTEFSDLNRMIWIKNQFGKKIGLSDHSLSIEVPVAAIAIGATVIEKHLTLSRSDGGPDASFSLEPWEFKKLVEAVKEIKTSMSFEIESMPRLKGNSDPHFNLRRSLYVVKDIAKGEKFSNENVRSIRPGYGLPPKYLGAVLGKYAAVEIQRGTPMSMEFVQ